MTATLDQPRQAIVPADTQLVINGESRASATGDTFEVLDPATAEVIVEVADAGPADGALAVDAAWSAFRQWRTSAPDLRAALLAEIRALVTSRAGEIASLITLEMGKNLAEATAEVAYASTYLRWFEQEALRLNGYTRQAPDGGAEHLIFRQGVGPALLISPWNFPLAMLARKVAPALAAGCTAVVKPAEDTPLTALLFQSIVDEAARVVGAPIGIVSTLPTSRPGELVSGILADPRIRKVSFTGSTRVGQILLAQASQNIQRASMELGGNAPFLVFPDADMEQAVEAAMAAKFRNVGQSCVGANRFLVHSDVAQEFTDALVAKVEQLTVGNGFDEGVDLGPVINDRQRQRVAGLVESALADGARVAGRSNCPDGPGFHYPATVLTGVSSSSPISREEIFGPVAAIQEFTSTDEAIDLANDTEFGLVSFAMTSDLTLAKRLARDLEAGMIGINRGVVSNAAAPFGGVKQSGLGREGGDEGINEYLESKYVAI